MSFAFQPAPSIEGSSLELGSAPRDGARIVAERLTRLSAARDGLGGGVQALAGSGSLRDRLLAPPQQVFQLTAQEIAEGRSPSAAHPAGWRYLVLENGEAVEAAELVDCVGGGGELHVAAVNRGPAVAGFVNAVTAAEAWASDQDDHYELRYFRIPSLHVTAAWLRNLDGGEDYFIPARPAFPPLQANQAYEAGDFARLLYGLAQKRLSQGDGESS